MKKFLLVVFVLCLFAGCSPKDDIKDGTHKGDGVVYYEITKNNVL